MSGGDSFSTPEKFSFQPRDWPEWKRNFELYYELKRLEKESQKYQLSALLYCMGSKANEVFVTLKFAKDDDKQNYAEVMKAFDAHFVGKRHVVYERAMFGSRCQREGESVEEFVQVLHTMSNHCEYKDLREELVRDRLVLGVADKKLSHKLMLIDGLTLERAVEVARQWELVKREAEELSGQAPPGEVDRVQQHKQARYRKNRQPWTSGNKPPDGSTGGAPQDQGGETCWNCGLEGHRANRKRSVQQRKKFVATARRSDITRSVAVPREVSQCAGERNKYLFQVNSHDRKLRWQQEVEVNGVKTEFKLDTGADVTILPYFVWKKNFKGRLKKCENNLWGVGGNSLCVEGTFTATVRHKEKSIVEEIYVVRYMKTALLGLDACEDLGLVVRVQEVEQKALTNVEVEKEYPNLFQGLGKLDQEYEIKLKPESKPFAVTFPRRVPLPLMDKLKKELEEMEAQGVIAQVDEPTPWCAPLVLTTKSSGSLRICVDLQKLNECEERELHMLPMGEHELGKLNGAKVFSQLDANSGFWQIPLSRNTEKLTTFITPFGRYHFKRLPFGITSAPEHFQKRMSSILRGLEGVVCLMDDILVFGATKEEHDKRLRAALERVQSSGLTLNKKKYLFGVKKVRFLGHVVDDEGIHPDPEKVKAVMEMGEPENVSEVRQILGHVNYLGKFIPNMSTKLSPLHALLKSDSTWIRDQPQKDAFAEVKKILSSDPVLAPYDMRKPTICSSDASSFGIGALIKQQQADGSWRPVCYASRTLTPTEKWYAQIEKEALGITWACDRFRDFLTGLEFQVETDHKPLLVIFKTRELGELSPRLQRFRMRMMTFNFKIFHTPGKELLAADYLSRHPLKNDDPYELESEVREHVRHVVYHLETTDERLEKLAFAQKRDMVIQKVQGFSIDGWPDKKKIDKVLLPYFEVKDDFSNADGLLLRHGRIVIPSAFRKDILARIHEGHFGINKCRERAKSSVWWPGISSDIEEMVRKCEVCAEQRPARHQPLIPSEFPVRPWQKVGMDLFYHGQTWYLIVCDYYSRYPEVVSLSSMSGALVIQHLKGIFSRHGVPEILYSDNGTQFSTRAQSMFQEFAADYGFKHTTSSPKFPQSNGFAEGAVRIAKLAMKKNVDVHKALLEYRATPLANGYSPAQLLFGRQLRTTLPCLPEKLVPENVLVEQLQQFETHRREKQKENYDRRYGTKEKAISVGEKVWIRDRREWGVVTKEADAPRSFWVKTGSGTYRRNTYHLESIGVFEQEGFDPDLDLSREDLEVVPEENAQEQEPEAQPERDRTRSRYGRKYKPRFKLNSKGKWIKNKT